VGIVPRFRIFLYNPVWQLFQNELNTVYAMSDSLNPQSSIHFNRKAWSLGKLNLFKT